MKRRLNAFAKSINLSYHAPHNFSLSLNPYSDLHLKCAASVDQDQAAQNMQPDL